MDPDGCSRHRDHHLAPGRGTLALKRQFGLIRITGPGNDRKIALESYDTGGILLWRHEIAARELRFPRER